jgi:hypothetical protein
MDAESITLLVTMVAAAAAAVFGVLREKRRRRESEPPYSGESDPPNAVHRRGPHEAERIRDTFASDQLSDTGRYQALATMGVHLPGDVATLTVLREEVARLERESDKRLRIEVEAMHARMRLTTAELATCQMVFDMRTHLDGKFRNIDERLDSHRDELRSLSADIQAMRRELRKGD